MPWKFLIQAILNQTPRLCGDLYIQFHQGFKQALDELGFHLMTGRSRDGRRMISRLRDYPTITSQSLRVPGQASACQPCLRRGNHAFANIEIWERLFRAEAETDNDALFREHIKRLDLPHKPELLIDGTILVMRACEAYWTLDQRDL